MSTSAPNMPSNEGDADPSSKISTIGSGSLLSYPFELYQSPTTKIKGLNLSTSSPLSHLYIILSTESKTTSWYDRHDGLPHTLEHAIFLGSDSYPYKGILDKLANRSLADGTNAWTATNHTCYTLSTAGTEGVLNLLPIYADHVLNPVMTDSSFVTEIHHVNEKGEDKGVVYCEMQGRENTEGSLVDRRVMDLLYGGDCGYSSETGGIMSNLRTLTNEQVRRYHEENYVPDNIMVVLTGSATNEEFIKAMNIVETNILKKNKSKVSLPRPWQTPVAELDLSMEGILPPYNYTCTNKKQPAIIQFPSLDETVGCVSIAWRGPSYHQRQLWTNIILLWEYLTDSPASPLQKAFVECDEPLCADVGSAHEILSTGYHQVWLTEADIDIIQDICPKLFDELKKAKDTFDLDRMRMVIRRYRRRLLEHAERSPTDAVIDSVINNFLHAERKDNDEETIKDLIADVDSLVFLDEAQKIDKEGWQAVFVDHMLDLPSVAVIGKPSAELSTSMAEEETKREEKQAKELGEVKLKGLKEKLDAAIAFNEREIPEDILTSVPVPSLEKVTSFPILTIRGNAKSLAIAKNSGKGVNLATQTQVMDLLQTSSQKASDKASTFWTDWNHIESNFIVVTLGLSIKSLDRKQRMYLSLLGELLFKLPAKLDDNTNLSKDEFISLLQDDTVSYSSGIGLTGGGSIPQLFHARIQVENDKAQGLVPALKWMRRILFLTVFNLGDVKTAVQKLSAELAPQFRSGSYMVASIQSHLDYNKETSNTLAQSPMLQKSFLKHILERLESPERAQSVIDDLNVIREKITQPENIQCFIAGNLLKITNDPISHIYEALLPPKHDYITSPPKDGSLIQNISASTTLSNKLNQCYIASLSAIENSFLLSTTPSLQSVYDPNMASLRVAIEYLTALEGDFWTKLRGAGLTYGYRISHDNDSSLLSFGLTKCSDIDGAYKVAEQILVGYATGTSTISDVGLENAKSSLAYTVIAGKDTKLSAANGCWVGNYLGKQVDYDSWLLKQITAVKKEDALHSIKKYLMKLFDPMANVSVACPVGKIETVCEFFQNRGCEVIRVPEEKLTRVFGDGEGADDLGTDVEMDKRPSKLARVSGVSMYQPGAFAAMFKCQCAKCDRD